MNSRSAGYADRTAAGRVLATALEFLRGEPGVVLGLPRGGVPVAAVVAATLGLPLDVLLVRKLGLPGQDELAMGAIAAVGPRIELVRNEAVLRQARVPDEVFDTVFRREADELRRRSVLFRGVRPAPDLSKLVVLVDDGLATGSTMRAAIQAVRAAGTSGTRIVVGAPVGSARTCAELRGSGPEAADEVVCTSMPVPFHAVGQAYRDFRPTPDAEVRRLLDG